MLLVGRGNIPALGSLQRILPCAQPREFKPPIFARNYPHGFSPILRVHKRDTRVSERRPGGRTHNHARDLEPCGRSRFCSARIALCSKRGRTAQHAAGHYNRTEKTVSHHGLHVHSLPLFSVRRKCSFWSATTLNSWPLD